jgi:hypothetical protein
MNRAFRHLQHVATDPSVTDALPISLDRLIAYRASF